MAGFQNVRIAWRDRKNAVAFINSKQFYYINLVCDYNLYLTSVIDNFHLLICIKDKFSRAGGAFLRRI